jgi:hypothetical protein
MSYLYGGGPHAPLHLLLGRKELYKYSSPDT